MGKEKRLRISLIILSLLTLLFLSSCTETRMQRVVVKARPAFNILPFNEIQITKFKIISTIDNKIIENEMLKTLKEEISIFFKKKIKIGAPINPSDESIFTNTFFWREYVRTENTAIITGIVRIKKEARSQIETVRDTPLSLKKKNVLKTLKLINSNITFFVYNGDTGKRVYKYRFNYKITDESGEADNVLVSRLISIAVDRFINRIVPREHIVYRYFFNF